MGVNGIRDLFEDIGVKAVRIENIIILDSHGDHTSAYLILGNLDTENFLIRESELGNYKHVTVFLLEPLGKIERICSIVCELVALTSFLSVSFTRISSMS